MFLKIFFFLNLSLLISCTPLESSLPVNSNIGGRGENNSEIGQTQLKTLPGLVRQSQVLPALSQCLGLKTTDLSTQTRTTYRSLRENLSEQGNIKDLSGPLLMAVVQLAGEVCNDLIQKERQNAGANFLTSFDLSSDSVTGSVNLMPSIVRITKSCWGRKILNEEASLIVSSYQSTSLNNNRGRRGALFLCTALMSSPDTILY